MDNLMKITCTELYDKISILPHATEGTIVDSILIIPTGELHESGFGIMHMFGIVDNDIKYFIDRGTDVIHLDGISGYGIYPTDWKENLELQKSPNSRWHIDCLPCGLLRIYCNGRIKIGGGFSDFEIYGVKNGVGN